MSLLKILTPEILACSESAQVRYACFKKGRKGEFERAKEMEAIRRSARDTKRRIPFSITHALQKTMRKIIFWKLCSKSSIHVTEIFIKNEKNNPLLTVIWLN